MHFNLYIILVSGKYDRVIKERFFKPKIYNTKIKFHQGSGMAIQVGEREGKKDNFCTLKIVFQDFPADPLVKNPHFHCWGYGLDP